MTTKFKVMKPLLRAGMLLAAIIGFFGFAAPASAEDRTLYLYYTHTGETAKITFRRNGRYDQDGLNKLNYFLRDWRRNEPTKMDPALFDLVWSVYQEVGATEPIHVVSAYRAPETNEMLRARSSGVAKNSRHTMGMAMDFFIPGIPLSKLREVAMKHQVGGVGYYPTSGSPFVHLDTGNVRAWPRMTTAQLRKLFPDGKTLHLGADGTVLSQSGRQYAAAQWQQCHSVPCINGTSNTQVNTGGNGRGLMDLFFGTSGGSEDIQVANNAPAQRQVTSVPITPPVPASRADLTDLRQALEPPIPAEIPQAILVAMRTDDQQLPSAQPQDERPLPRLLMSNPAPAAGLLSAYAPTGEPEPDAQRALQMLIERRNAEQPDAPQPVDPSGILLRGTITTASLGPPVNLGAEQPELPEAIDLFSSTFAALDQNTDTQLQPMLQTAALQKQTGYDMVAVEMRNVALYEPDLGHVDQAFVAPVTLDSSQFAVLFQPDEGDFSPETELGPHTALVRFTSLAPGWLPADQFARVAPVFNTSL